MPARPGDGTDVVDACADVRGAPSCFMTRECEASASKNVPECMYGRPWSRAHCFTIGARLR